MAESILGKKYVLKFSKEKKKKKKRKGRGKQKWKKGDNGLSHAV